MTFAAPRQSVKVGLLSGVKVALADSKFTFGASSTSSLARSVRVGVTLGVTFLVSVAFAMSSSVSLGVKLSAFLATESSIKGVSLADFSIRVSRSVP